MGRVVWKYHLSNLGKNAWKIVCFVPGIGGRVAVVRSLSGGDNLVFPVFEDSLQKTAGRGEVFPAGDGAGASFCSGIIYPIYFDVWD